MWCPKCKNEYVRGITECADCHIPLVETLADAEEFYEKERQAAFNEEELEENVVTPETGGHVYVKKETAYEDMKSTATTFLCIGTLGIICLLLWGLGVIRLQMEGYMKILMFLVMGTLFVVFLIIGIRYQMRLKSVKEEAGSEKQLTEEIIRWFLDNYSADDIDAGIADTSVGEEQLYFQRYEVMERCISSRYPDLDHAYQDHMLEELYGRIFQD